MVKRPILRTLHSVQNRETAIKEMLLNAISHHPNEAFVPKHNLQNPIIQGLFHNDVQTLNIIIFKKTRIGQLDVRFQTFLQTSPERQNILPFTILIERQNKLVIAQTLPVRATSTHTQYQECQLSFP